MQLAPSAAECERAATADDGAAATAVSVATDIAENLAIALVQHVIDDNATLGAAALRTLLATCLPHHLSPAADALVVAGPFGIGKRQLMQRMLSLYPDGFEMPRVYTTDAVATGGMLTVVDAPFLAALRQRGMLAFAETAVGEDYAVSLEDVAQCAIHFAMTERCGYTSLWYHIRIFGTASI